jgi:hypothetical protein
MKHPGLPEVRRCMGGAKRWLLLGALAFAMGFAWWRHRRWVHEFDNQDA